MCKKGSGRRKRGLTELNIRSECIDGRGVSLRRGNHALACRSLHIANTTQVLEVEEVQGRRGLRIVGGANDRLRRQMHQIGDTLQVDGKRATLQDAMRESPEEVKCPSQTKHEEAGNTLTSERTGSSERPSEMGSVSVKSMPWAAGAKRAAKRALQRGCHITWT